VQYFVRFSKFFLKLRTYVLSDLKVFIMCNVHLVVCILVTVRC